MQTTRGRARSSSSPPIAGARWTPLANLAAQLDPADFAQVHRSVIVNLHAVAGTQRDRSGKLCVRIRDHARELPVARRYVHLFGQV